MGLHNRLVKLEKSRPKVDPIKERLRNMSREELHEEIFLTRKILYEAGHIWDVSDKRYGGELIALNDVPKLRQFVSKGKPWLSDYSHRRDVCWIFKECVLKLSLPYRECAVEILTDGWRDYEIPTDDIVWVCANLEGRDLGEEQPWLRGYLEHSGKR
ncbi:hypothetical protein [Methyloglobulus sp.]|uniref:hypothetical protein n=1 Tax=Methyloglobulus sp. TaxID=2518622 RepID=UPI0039895F0D